MVVNETVLNTLRFFGSKLIMRQETLKVETLDSSNIVSGLMDFKADNVSYMCVF